jgi:uncharacterized protein involved in exopolysaccharide biosynthesis
MLQQETEGLGIYPREIIAVLYRRSYWLILPILAGMIIAGVMIYLQKPMYRSSATLLIDSQEIPTSVVPSPLTNFANDRIAKIRQQITSRDSLTALISRHALYSKLRSTTDFANVLDVMRNAIGVELVGANEGSSGGGNTIAFTLSFTYDDAAMARTVTSDLTQMFLVADKRFRTTQASGTASFLGRRAEEYRRQLTSLEEKRRAVEAKYAGALPSQVSLNAQSGSSLRAEVSRIDAETQGLVQQNSLLATRAQELVLAPTPGMEALRRAEERLQQLSATYADNYPDVIAARATVERQRKALAQSDTPRTANVIEAEIAAGRSRAGLLAMRRADLVSTISHMDSRAAQAPQASYELNMIEREYDNIKRQYESLREKQLDAQVAANLQSEDKGERFSIVDEPSLPHESLGRKPLAVLLSGVLTGAGIGVAIIIGFEFLAGNIHGEQSLTRLLGAPPMGVIPVVKSPGRRSWLPQLRLPWSKRQHATAIME